MKRGHQRSERRPLLLLTRASSIAFIAGVFACTASNEESGSSVPEFLPSAAVDAGQTGDANTEDVAPMTSRHGCSDDGFCYVSVPADAPLAAVSASSAEDAWMIPASGGALLHWDGTSIERVYEYDGASPEGVSYVALWARQRDNVWALAHGSDAKALVVRYASRPGGGAPEFRALRTSVSSSASMSAWGTPAGDALWVAKSDGVFHIREDADGPIVADLSPVPAADDPSGYYWYSIWGFAPDDVYVAGKVCVSRPCTVATAGQGAIARYDGMEWSIMPITNSDVVTSVRGTPPGAARQLWYTVMKQTTRPGAKATNYRTELVPILSDGTLGVILHAISSTLETVSSAATPPASTGVCSSTFGQATAPSTGWFSNGLIACQWVGTQVTPVTTNVDGRPIIASLNGLWADSTDDVWIVGGAIARDRFPSSPFAARRTAATARGETP